MLLALVLAAAPSVSISGTVNGKAAPAGILHAKAGEPIVLHATVRGAKPPTGLRWFKLEPTTSSLDNTTPSFHFADVAYAEDELEACRDQEACAVDAVPTHLPKVPGLEGLGAMAFRVEATLPDGKTVSSPGREAMKYGGLTPEVFKIAVRRDDSLIGYATELLNTPYIFGSAGPDGRNQSDWLIGSDCADFVIYARRRMGKPATYTSSYELDRQAPEVKRGAAQVGDLVHFPSMRHVAILFEDRPPRGVVDENDLILHTCWAPPTVQRIGDTDCVAPPYRVLRFPAR